MAKKDKLYTVNPWNQAALMQRGNVFDNGGEIWQQLAAQNRMGTEEYMQSKGGLFNLSKKNNPFSKGNLKTVNSDPAAGAAIGAAATLVGGLANKGISDGFSSGAGSTISSLGSAAGNVVGQFNPVLGAAVTVGSNIVGGLTNRAFGSKTNQAALNAANEGTASLKSFNSNASSFDDVRGITAVSNVENAYQGGWFAKGSARRKNALLRRQREEALGFANRSIDNNVDNLINEQMDNALANYAAFGGPLEMIGNNDNMGAIDYSFMSDWLTNKARQTENKEKTIGLNGLSDTMFALGGDLQSHGADWSDGMTTISAGKSHETNPNEGVQMGVDGEGVPNLVEEGETVYNDFVYSNRILVNDEVKQRFHLPKKKEMSYADVSKKLEKEAAERPNDPISQNAFKKQMGKLAEMQEKQKAEMEAERAREAFEKLSPEEKAMVMQKMAQEEAAVQEAAQQQAMQEAAMQAQQEEIPAETIGTEAATMMQQSGQEMACGGKINKFDGGGKKSFGKWKDDKSNHWDLYTKPGLEGFLERYEKLFEEADTDEKKAALRKEMMDEFNAIQQGYADIYPKTMANAYDFSDAVERHQQLFDKAGGNKGFYSTDENGNTRNLIAEAIDMPQGHATSDTPVSWVDGYWGPRTSIRNFGSTEYGDEAYYKDLADRFSKLGVTYAPNSNWTYGENGANQLYGLSVPTVENVNNGQTVYHDPDFAPGGKYGPQAPEAEDDEAGVVEKPEELQGEEQQEFVPKHRAEWPRYAGLFGPAAGLGLWAAGVGKPDYSELNAAVEAANQPAHLAKWKPIGDYLTYKPFDTLFYANQLQSNARATDRALANSVSPSKAAGLLANGYNTTNALGNLYRQAEEYNLGQRAKVAEFNRGTNQYNSQAYQRNSEFNADALNRNRQYAANMALNAAAQRMGADAGWYNSLYGNISGLAKGLSDLGRENTQYNWMVDLLGSGVIPGVDDKKMVKAGMGKYVPKTPKVSKDGGKVTRRKGRKGLTF